MIDYKEVYPWLNQFTPSHIGPATKILIDQIISALSENKEEETSGLLQQLKDFAYTLRDTEEITEVLVECAYGFYMLKRLKEAEVILTDAISRSWSDLHRRAVIQWMLGCVQWQTFPSRQHAMISWRNSLLDFELLARQPGLPIKQRNWYQASRGNLEQSLLETMEQFGNYLDLDGDGSSVMPENEVPARPGFDSMMTQSPDPGTISNYGTFKMEESIAFKPSDILQLFTISNEIPAGDFGPSGIDPFPIGTVEVDRLSINGHPYSIHSLRGRKIIDLAFDQKLLVIKVKGDSMDQEGILEQDYVIVRKVDVPYNGDIVMAEIVGIDSKATLKIYFKEKDTITLKPHSSNPVHKPFVFNKISKGFFIRGVVVAVLKPA